MLSLTELWSQDTEMQLTEVFT